MVDELIADGLGDNVGVGDRAVAGDGDSDFGSDGVAEPAGAYVVDADDTRDRGGFIADAVDELGVDAVERAQPDFARGLPDDAQDSQRDDEADG